MFLYLVTCVCGNDEEFIYTIASGFDGAETKALKLMKDIGYGKNNSVAREIELVAANIDGVVTCLLAL